MKVAKTSLVAMLLEVGEENVAVLLARSTLPDELDTERDLAVLIEYGLEPDSLEKLASTAAESAADADESSIQLGGDLDRVVSRRWADLVGQWVSAGST